MQRLYKRVLPVEETYRRLQLLMPRVGITHVLELTALDTLGLPVCMAFGSLPGNDPRSLAAKALSGMLALDGEGAPGDERPRDRLEQVWDSMETFTPANSKPAEQASGVPVMAAGKGLAALDARVSAMMEAVERYSARRLFSTIRRASYRKISEHELAVDPRSLLLISPADFDEDQPLDWVHGREINSAHPAWVPVEASLFNGQLRAEGRTFVDTPTGLGAGNVIAEAICHGLAEAIEHDAWALAVARQAMVQAAQGLFGEGAAARAGEDVRALPFRSIDPQAFKELDDLTNGWLENLQHNGGWVRIHDITADLEVPVVSAALSGIPAERLSSPSPDGGGLGAHPDARVALARSLTEAAQQRLILAMQQQMQRSRMANDAVEQGGGAAHWAVAQDEQQDPLKLSEINSATLPTIQEDIRYMLKALQERGYEQVVVVDLTKTELETPVVKVIVPGLADYWNSAAPPDWQSIQRRLRRQKEYNR